MTRSEFVARVLARGVDLSAGGPALHTRAFEARMSFALAAANAAADAFEASVGKFDAPALAPGHTGTCSASIQSRLVGSTP